MGKIFRRYSKHEKKALCEEWQTSELSQREYCDMKGINISTFNGWLKKAINKQREKFFEVEISKDSLYPSKEAEPNIEIKTINGTIIKIPIVNNQSLVTKILGDILKCK